MRNRSALGFPQVAALQEALADRFVFLSLVGQGGSAYVFRARDVASRRQVAIKVLHPKLFAEPEARAAFLREAELVEGLKHDNIVPILEVINVDRVGCALVMPFVEGHTLKEEIKSTGALPIPMVRTILSDLLPALGYAHQRGIVHCDIKPQNVFLDGASGRCMIGDFGIAARMDEHVSAATPNAMGTPQYMSPEQIDGRSVDQRSDVYSVGCLAFEMLTGAEPWAGLSLSEVLQRQRNLALPSVSISRPETPADLTTAVARCVLKDPAQRWQSAEELAGALQHHPNGPRIWKQRASASALEGLSRQVALLVSRLADPKVLVSVGSIILLAGLFGTANEGEQEAREAPSANGTIVDGARAVGGPQESVTQGRVLTGQGRQSTAPVVNRQPQRQEAQSRETSSALRWVRDEQASELLERAKRVAGSGEGFDVILDLQLLSQSGEVSPRLRKRLEVVATNLILQCESLRDLNASVQCP